MSLLVWCRMGISLFIPMLFVFPRYYIYHYVSPDTLAQYAVSSFSLLGVEHILIYATLIGMTLAARCKETGLMRLAYLLPLIAALFFFAVFSTTHGLAHGARALLIVVTVGYLYIFVFHMITVKLMHNKWIM